MPHPGAWISIDEPVDGEGWYAVLCLAGNGQILPVAAFHAAVGGWGHKHTVFARSPSSFATRESAEHHALQHRP